MQQATTPVQIDGGPQMVTGGGAPSMGRGQVMRQAGDTERDHAIMAQQQEMARRQAAMNAARAQGQPQQQGLAGNLPQGLYAPVSVGTAAPVAMPGGGFAQGPSDEVWDEYEAKGWTGGRAKPTGLEQMFY